MSASTSSRFGRRFFLVEATASRTTAASPTRNPVNASGVMTDVAYFSTLKFTPQMRAISSSNPSVFPNPAVLWL